MATLVIAAGCGFENRERAPGPAETSAADDLGAIKAYLLEHTEALAA